MAEIFLVYLKVMLISSLIGFLYVLFCIMVFIITFKIIIATIKWIFGGNNGSSVAEKLQKMYS